MAISLTGNLQLQFFLDMIGSCCSVALAVIIIKSRGYGINVRFALWSSTENIQTTIKKSQLQQPDLPTNGWAGFDLVILLHLMDDGGALVLYVHLPACM